MSTFEQATNGNWFDHNSWTFFSDDGFGNLIEATNWPAMNVSSLKPDDDYLF